MIGKINPHRILLVKLHQSLVDDHPSRTPKRLVESLHHIIELGWNLRLWNTLTPKMVVHNITNTRPHGLKCRLEAVGHYRETYRRAQLSKQHSYRIRPLLDEYGWCYHATILDRPSETKQLLSIV